MEDGAYINWRDVEANKRRAKERVRIAKTNARIEWLYRNRGWIIPVGYLFIIGIAYLFVLALGAVL